MSDKPEELHMLEFFAYETIGMTPTHVGPIWDVTMPDGTRILFPDLVWRDEFLAMSPEQQQEYIKSAIERQHEEAASEGLPQRSEPLCP